ncbi:uncharacterized protein LOC142813843 [Rhipicephalus microplus]|uniref:uncharacterized protein LOC142813843 n=1 Tax=Rhipicephalus microplus TaxID=6941 RepID=UPI003F6B58E7
MDVPVENVVNMVPEGSTAPTTKVDSIEVQKNIALGASVVLTAAVVCSMDFILDKVGFGKEGVKPGSLAATWQASMHGNVPRWSKFALLQRWGVKGIPGRFKFSVGYVIFFFTFLLLAPHSLLEEPR